MKFKIIFHSYYPSSFSVKLQIKFALKFAFVWENRKFTVHDRNLESQKKESLRWEVEEAAAEKK